MTVQQPAPIEPVNAILMLRHTELFEPRRGKRRRYQGRQQLVGDLSLRTLERLRRRPIARDNAQLIILPLDDSHQHRGTVVEAVQHRFVLSLDPLARHHERGEARNRHRQTLFLCVEGVLGVCVFE